MILAVKIANLDAFHQALHNGKLEISIDESFFLEWSSLVVVYFIFINTKVKLGSRNFILIAALLF